MTVSSWGMAIDVVKNGMYSKSGLSTDNVGPFQQLEAMP